VVLDTLRLTLRRMTASDAPFMLTLLNDPDFIAYIGDRGVRTLQASREYIDRGPIASYAQFGFGLYAVELKSTRDSIGICGLLQRAALPAPDLGFAFLPAFRSQGYALEAASAVCAHARDVLHIPRLLAITSVANDRSIRLLEKIGFSFEGLTRLTIDGEDLKLFGQALT
jgi:RimJ/RimL family protein N-acetyltransferase